MSRRSTLPFIVGGLLVAVGLAVFVSPLASTEPDGLERVAADQGFADDAATHDLADSPLADYGVRGVSDERTSTAVSGLIGTLITFGVGLLLFGALRRYRERHPAASP